MTDTAHHPHDRIFITHTLRSQAVPQRLQIRDRGKSSTCSLLNLRGFHREIFVNLKNKVILELRRKMNGVLCYTAGRTEPLCFDFFFSLAKWVHWAACEERGRKQEVAV